MTPPPLVEMRAIAKSFGAVIALRRVDLRLGPGEVLGPIGQLPRPDRVVDERRRAMAEIDGRQPAGW